MLIEKILGFIVGVAIVEAVIHIPPIRRAYNRRRLKVIEQEKRQIEKETALNLDRKQKENESFRTASKPLTQQSFEEWKAEKRKRDQGGFIDLDAEINLPWMRTT